MGSPKIPEKESEDTYLEFLRWARCQMMTVDPIVKIGQHGQRARAELYDLESFRLLTVRADGLDVGEAQRLAVAALMSSQSQQSPLRGLLVLWCSSTLRF